MKLLVKSMLGALAAMSATAGQAQATCILFICFPDGRGGSPSGPQPPAPTPHGAPEIDVTQGIAAAAILVCALLILRERFVRQRP